MTARRPKEPCVGAPERFVLVTGRTIYQGVGKEQGKLSDEYFQSVALCEMDPTDMHRMMIAEHSSVRITTPSGSVVVKAVESLRAPHPRMVYMPYGPWASILMASETEGTGMPSLKGVPATLKAVPQETVLTVRGLLDAHYREE